MSIAPASDILLDMAHAAEPSRARAALARLTGDSSVSFTQLLDARATSEKQPVTRSSVTLASLDAGAPRAGRKLPAPVELEAFFLQNFIELVLPKDESLFGGGVAGESWRSMMAEQMARNIAVSGGIGLAAHFAKKVTDASGDGAPRT